LRAIFFTLLSVNLVLLLWGLFVAPSNTTASPPVDEQSVAVRHIKPAEVAATNASSEAPKERCALIGPFTNLAQADILVERLAALDVNAGLHDVPIPTQKAYWVYLTPMEHKKAAFKKLSELQSQGIDSYVIPKGELQNGISLGLFNDRELANAHKTSLNERGYPAEIKEEIRTVVQSWVVADAKSANILSPSAWSDLLSGLKNITYQQNYCPDVASSQ